MSLPSLPFGNSKRQSGQGRVKRVDSKKLFEDALSAPAVGGCVDLAQPHSDYLLPPEVVLFEPTTAEIFQGGSESGGTRQIFLNTPLTSMEVAKLGELHAALRDEALVTEQGDEEFPPYVGLHALRLLQQRKFNVKKALDLILLHLDERARRLPIAEKDVLQDLKNGFMYWHGRDRKCRPCLVIRMENMGDMNMNRERAVRLVIFVLEYALRYCMVPGRVENWVVILDLQNASKVVSVFHMASLAATAKVIATTLESVYCGRMVWMKILNMPSVMRKVIESCIPSEKKKKVQFVANPAAELAEHFEPNQLEARYGGTAPNLAPSATYPFHFFPRACPSTAAEQMDSLHRLTSRAFHEGKLWDTSLLPEKSRQWMDIMQYSSLTPSSAEALLAMNGGMPVKPCRDLAHLKLLLEGGQATSVRDSAIGTENPKISVKSDAEAGAKKGELDDIETASELVSL